MVIIMFESSHWIYSENHSENKPCFAQYVNSTVSVEHAELPQLFFSQ